MISNNKKLTSGRQLKFIVCACLDILILWAVVVCARKCSTNTYLLEIMNIFQKSPWRFVRIHNMLTHTIPRNGCKSINADSLSYCHQSKCILLFRMMFTNAVIWLTTFRGQPTIRRFCLLLFIRFYWPKSTSVHEILQNPDCLRKR